MKKIQKILNSVLLFCAFPLFAQKIQIDYYGVVANGSADSNMLRMAQDIFLTQLKSLDYVEIRDCRQDPLKVVTSVPDFSGNAIAFYVEISDDISETRTWKCRFNAFAPQKDITYSKTRVYDSYYKIMSDAKNSIEGVIADFKQDDSGKSNEKTSVRTFSGNIDIESLAGTWHGEPFTDKILILRGGRGFIIFKNGATMNIKIFVKRFDSKGNVAEIEIRQIGKSNASFFPELPRQTALSLAETANPILWTFTIQNGNLVGSKKTLVPASNELGAEEGTLDATWSKF